VAERRLPGLVARLRNLSGGRPGPAGGAPKRDAGNKA
jgi:hypothetical protein